MENKKYQITVNRQQLRLIADCIEDCHRFIAGQTGMDNSTFVLSEYCNIRKKLKELHSLVVPELHQESGDGASYDWAGNGCEDEKQRKFIAQTYYLYREIRHFLANENNNSNFNVYRSKTLRCEDSGEPIIIKENE